MPKNNTQKQHHAMPFEQPQRLILLALLGLFNKLFKSIFSQFWPLFIIYFFQINKTDANPYQDHWSLMAIYVVLIIGVVSGVIQYVTFRWFLEKDALVIRYGWLRKVNLKIPFDRIQTIHLQQPWYYRFTHATRFVIDTAGATKKEGEIWALNSTLAKNLRAFILEQKNTNSKPLEEASATQSNQQEHLIALSAGQLLRIGLLKNHFRSLLVFVGGGLYLYSQAQKIVDIDRINNALENLYEFMPKTYAILTAFFAVIIFVTFMVSIVTTFISFYGFNMKEQNHTLFVKQGLISIKAQQIQLQKIQLIKTIQGPLFKRFRLMQFKIKQAYAKEARSKKDLQLPGCPEALVQNLIHRIVGKPPAPMHPGTSSKWCATEPPDLDCSPQ